MGDPRRRSPPGTRLPSTRALAEALGVSRSTIISSFAQLHSEGYLQATTGSGTFVSAELAEERRSRAPTAADAGKASIRLSTYGASLTEAGPLEPPRRAARSTFATAARRSTRFRTPRGGARSPRRHGTARGSTTAPIRPAICRCVKRSPRIWAGARHACTARDVTIVNGSQQAIDLVARVLIEPGDVVALEEPGYLGAQRTFSAHGADLRAIAVDHDGIRVDCWSVTPHGARLVYVTPSHQFPLGVLLAATRRRALLAWAERSSAIVVEDDYDSAYRYEGRPIPALYGLDHSGRVVYVGTFSKTMFPALRIGYVVAPPALRNVIQAAKAFADRQSPILEQRALASFIVEGSFERHLRRMRVLYRARRAALLESLRRHIGDGLEVSGESAGMHLVVRLPLLETERFIERARRAGVALMSTAPHHLRDPVPGEFIFGFAEHDEATMEEAIARLGRILPECR